MSSVSTCQDIPVPLWHPPWRVLLHQNPLRPLYDLLQLQSKLFILASQSFVLFNPKHVGPGYVISGHTWQVSEPIVAFQSRCNTPRVSAWCHQNPLMTSLRPPPVKIAYLGFPSSVFANPKHAWPGYAICGHICQVSVPVETFQSHCDTPRDVTMHHQNSRAASLQPPPVKIV